MKKRVAVALGLLGAIGSVAAACSSSSSSDGAAPSPAAGSSGAAGSGGTSATGGAGASGKSGGAGTSATGGAGGSSAGGSSAGSDSGLDAGTDAADASAGLTCAQLIKCDQACGNSGTCTDQCFFQTTQNGQFLFNTFNACLNESCPNSGGGPCAMPNSTECSTCNQNAGQGACIGQLLPCLSDKMKGTANEDGGTPTGDAGTGELSCGGFVACVSNCPTDSSYENCTSVCKFSATPTAVELDGMLNDCLATACPTTAGSVCATPGTACAGCQEQAVFAQPNICATQWTNCQADTSASGDAGTVMPASLEDGGTLSFVANSIVQAASTLVVSNGFLYFTQVDSDSPVLRMPANGTDIDVNDAGTTLTSFGPPQQTPCGLAVDAKNAYVWSYGSFSGQTSFNNNDGTVTQIPLDGSPAITLDSGMETFYDAPYLTSVAVDSKYVYWVKGANGPDGMIMRADIGGANVKQLYTMQQIPEALASDGTNVYWVNWGTFDATGASNNDATVWQGPVDGGTPLMLASNQEAPAAIVVDAKNVYWTNLGKLGASLFPATDSGSVVQVPIGGGPTITIASGQGIPIGLAVSGDTIYWTVYGLSVPGEVVSAPVGGGTSLPLVGGLDNPFSLTLSGKTLYWTNTPSSNGGGTIFSFTQP